MHARGHLALKMEENEQQPVEVIELQDNPEDEIVRGLLEVNDEEVGHDEDLEELDNEMMDEDDVPDDAIVVFKKHTGSVFCCDVDPVFGQLVVSGGEDDHAFVWDVTSGEVKFDCAGHRDSVTSAKFSYDGSYVVTGDMSGLIKVWKVEDQTEVWAFEMADLAWLEWHHSSNVLLAGNMIGEVWLWRIPHGDCKIFSGHGAQTDCGKFTHDGVRAAVGYNDGVVKLWDLKSGSAIHTVAGSSSGEDSGITCLDCYKDNVLLITGSIDNTAKIINTNSGKVVASLECGNKSAEGADSVESVGFCKSFPLCATGTLHGSLRIWDISTCVERQHIQQDVGISLLAWDAATPLVYTACLDGVVRLWDARSGTLAAQWSGHSGEILDLALTRDGNTMITASDDKHCRVFSINQLDR